MPETQTQKPAETMRSNANVAEVTCQLVKAATENGDIAEAILVAAGNIVGRYAIAKAAQDRRAGHDLTDMEADIDQLVAAYIRKTALGVIVAGRQDRLN